MNAIHMPTSIGKRLTLAAVGTVGVAAALGLAAFEHTGSPLPTPAASSSAIPSPAGAGRGPIAITVSWCPSPTPTKGNRQGTHPPIQPFSTQTCGANGSVSGPDGGGQGDTGENPGGVQTGNDPGDPNTPPSGGGGGNCIGLEIECHQPF